LGLEEITLVGDRGVLTGTQIKKLKQYPGIRHISALRGDSIRQLIERVNVNRSLLDETQLACFRRAEQAENAIHQESPAVGCPPYVCRHVLAFLPNSFGFLMHLGGRDARVPVRRRFAANLCGITRALPCACFFCPVGA
jgi:hypothetical protein